MKTHEQEITAPLRGDSLNSKSAHRKSTRPFQETRNVTYFHFLFLHVKSDTGMNSLAVTSKILMTIQSCSGVTGHPITTTGVQGVPLHVDP